MRKFVHKWSYIILPVCLMAAVFSGCTSLTFDDLKSRAQEKAEDFLYQVETSVQNESQTEVLAPSISTGRYVYDTLTQEEQKVYDEILNTILNHKEDQKLSTRSTEVLKRSYEAVNADYGELFWTNGYSYTQFTLAGKVTGMEFTPQYTMAPEEQSFYQQQVDTAVTEFLSGVTQDQSDYEKAKYVFEKLIETVDYRTDSPNNQNILSVFLSHATVCQGYASAAQYLLTKLGIQSCIVTGTANGQPHAWNLVRLDGMYYYMDPTWGNSMYRDDTSSTSKYVNYAYLAFTTDQMVQTHSLAVDYPVPDCTANDDDYYVREGKYITAWEPEKIGAILKQAWDEKQENLSLRFATRDLYMQMYAYFITDQKIAAYCKGLHSVYYVKDDDSLVLTFNFIKNN